MSPKYVQFEAMEFRFMFFHLWLLCCYPLLYSWWVFGRLSTLEGTIDLDANVLGFQSETSVCCAEIFDILRQPSFAYANMDYPLLGKRVSTRSTTASSTAQTNSSTKSGHFG